MDFDHQAVMQAAYEEFKARVHQLDLPTKQDQPAWKKLAVENNACPSCGTLFDSLRPSQRYITNLVPVSSGGPATTANAVMMCASCAKKRGQCDITDPSFTSRLGGPLPQALLTRRLQLLTGGANHLTRCWPMAPVESVRAELEKRYAHPRFRVYAHASYNGCFVGYRMRVSEPQAYAGASAMLRLTAQATVEEENGCVFFRVPQAKMMDALWAMIDTNGLVVAVHLSETPCTWAHVSDLDWRSCWTEIYERFGDNRRRYGTGQRRQAWPPRAYSTNKNTIRSRKRDGGEQKRKQRRDAELRHAARMESDFNRWIDPNDPGYKFRPLDADVWRTYWIAGYWRCEPSLRHIYLLNHPEIGKPSFE